MLGARARVLQDMISEARSRGLDPDEQASLAALLEGLRRLLSGERRRSRRFRLICWYLPVLPHTSLGTGDR